MSKSRKVVGATAAVAAGPSGVKRLAAGCLMVVLLGALMIAGLVAFGTWSARNNGESSALPCPPSPVAVAWSTSDAPSAARTAVTEALRQAGRKPVEGGWDAGEQRDLVVVWSPGTGTRVSGGSNPVQLRLGAVPTAAEVTQSLGARLAPCEATPAPSATATPWERGWGATGVLGLIVAVWWLAGPNLARGLWRAAWPVRLARRRWQRWVWRRAVRVRGRYPTEWPLRIEPGQRWHESDEAMHDHRTYRAQIAEGEPARRRALRAAIREERLADDGWTSSLWRRIYRNPVPEPGRGAPEKEGVLP